MFLGHYLRWGKEVVSIECTCVIKKFSRVIVSGESGECSIKDVHGKVLDQIRLCRFSCTLPYSPPPPQPGQPVESA